MNENKETSKFITKAEDFIIEVATPMKAISARNHFHDLLMNIKMQQWQA